MRTFIIIITMLMQGVHLAAFQGEALIPEKNNLSEFSEEITASWEGKSDAVLMGERVIYDLKHKKNGGLTVNSICSAESIERLSALRKLVSDVIALSIESGNTFSESYTASDILKRISAASFTPLTNKETDLISSAEKSYVSIKSFHGRGFSSNSATPPEFGVLIHPAVFTISTKIKFRIFPDKKCSHNLQIKKIICSSERFDREFADLYRLFLYVRDNSGNRKPHKLTCSNGALRIIGLLCDSNQYISSDKTNIIIPQGASS